MSPRSHASAAPWEGKNALDAAVLAYSSISSLRQQIKVCGTIQTTKRDIDSIEPRSSLHIVFMELSRGGTGHQTVRITYFSVCSECSNQRYLLSVIPDYSRLRYLVRAPTAKEATVLTERVKHCFE